jgi:hypothetical protein
VYQFWQAYSSVGLAFADLVAAVSCCSCRMTTKVTQIGKYTVPAGTIVGECLWGMEVPQQHSSCVSWTMPLREIAEQLC